MKFPRKIDDSFNDWWQVRGKNLFPQEAKAAFRLAFVDGWYRSRQALQAEAEKKSTVAGRA